MLEKSVEEDLVMEVTMQAKDVTKFALKRLQ